MKSNVLHVVDEGQLELGLRPAPRPQLASLPKEIIEGKPTMTSALLLGIEASGLEDKQVYLELGIDPGQFSRIRSGSAHFNPDLLSPVCDIMGNEAPLIWFAGTRGYDLVPRQSTIEQQLQDEKEKNALLQLKVTHMEEFMGMMK